MDRPFDLLGLLHTFYRWRIYIIGLCVAAGLGSIVVTLLMPNYYEASTTFLAASPDQSKPEILFGGGTIESQYYGNKHDSARLLTLAESKEVVQSLVDSFELYEHYDIDPDDPRAQEVMRGSTVGWREGAQTPLIHFLLPEDFGSASFYERRRSEFDAHFASLEEAADLEQVFEGMLEGAETLRDYLWVAEDDAEELARAALSTIPKDVILRMIRWTVADFWHRQPGWPDLLLLKAPEYRFSEVKSPNDKLSLEQMQWFEWALVDAEEPVPCEVCRIVKRANSS